MALTYTTIQHGFRKANGLSLNEYTLCDMIYHLSTKPSSSVPGWCYMTKNSMAHELGCTKQAILNMLDRLILQGFLIKNEETKYLKTAEKWNSVYELIDGKESLPEVKKVYQHGKESLPQAGKETLPNNNNTNKNRDKEAEASLFVSLIDQSSEIFSEAGMAGVFFQKVKNLHSISDVEVNRFHHEWKKKHQALGTNFQSKDHLKRSFNKFIAEAKSSGGKTGIPAVMHAPERAKGGRLI